MKANSYEVFKVLLAILVILVPATTSIAHCDSEDGPIIPSIREALDDGNIRPLLKWIAPDDENEITALFDRVRVVRNESDEAKRIADQLFIETFIRLHRAGEGAPYTGIKPAGTTPPIFAQADKALESGDVQELSESISGAVQEAIAERFQRALELSTHQAESVAAGRDFVEAYVTYLHFVEGLHTYLQTAGKHQAVSPEHGH